MSESLFSHSGESPAVCMGAPLFTSFLYQFVNDTFKKNFPYSLPGNHLFVMLAEPKALY